MATAMLTVLTGIVYPLAIWVLAQTIFPSQAGGSLIVAGNKVVGSSLVGQNFSSPRYFQSRPSAAGDKGYDASNSGGSNLGPTNKALMAIDPANPIPQARALIVKWGALHAVRSALGSLATIAFLFGFIPG